jgi:Leu/Phe-tRNA-protein transferase
MEGAIMDRASEEGDPVVGVVFGYAVGAVRMGESQSLATPDHWKIAIDRLFEEQVKQT